MVKAEKDNRILKVSAKKIYAWIYAFSFIVVLWIALLMNHEWSAYAYSVKGKVPDIIFLGSASSEKACHKLANKKIDQGVQLTRDEYANTHFCGKHCFELPHFEDLRRFHIFCMINQDT